MRYLKPGLGVLALLLWIQVEAQDTDSTKLYCEPLWIEWRIERDLQRLDVCDSALELATQTIREKNEAIKNAQRTISSQDTVIKAQSFQLESQVIILDLERQKSREENKQLRKERNKFVLVSFVELIVILFLIF